MRAPQMVFGLHGLGRSMAGAVGAGVALLTVAPLLVPVALLALIPGWLANHHRGRAFYHFGFVMELVDRLAAADCAVDVGIVAWPVEVAARADGDACLADDEGHVSMLRKRTATSRDAG